MQSHTSALVVRKPCEWIASPMPIIPPCARSPKLRAMLLFDLLPLPALLGPQLALRPPQVASGRLLLPPLLLPPLPPLRLLLAPQLSRRPVVLAPPSALLFLPPRPPLPLLLGPQLPLRPPRPEDRRLRLARLPLQRRVLCHAQTALALALGRRHPLDHVRLIVEEHHHLHQRGSSAQGIGAGHRRGDGERAR